MPKHRTILFIYSNAQADLANSIADFLAEELDTKIHNSGNQLILEARNEVASDSAIVLCCDEAVTDPAWQESVRSLPDDMRIITVGSFKIADYNDADEVPPRVSAIQCISIDDRLPERLIDALMTSPDFYKLRNTLSIEITAWEASGRDSRNLMPGLWATRSALRKVRQRRKVTTDDSLDEQLSNMETYLRESHKRALKGMARKIPVILPVAFAVFIIAVGLYYLAISFTWLHRANQSYALLEDDSNLQPASERALMALDGLYNPFVNDWTKRSLYLEINTLLDENWPNTPIGTNYKWRLLDATIGESSQYIWTSNSNGSLVLWDTHTGQIIDRVSLSDQPLILCESIDGGRLMVAVDSGGTAIVRDADDTLYTFTLPSDTFDPTTCKLSTSEDGSILTFYDNDSVAVYVLSEDRATFVHQVQFDEIIGVTPNTGSSWTAYVMDDGKLSAKSYDGPTLLSSMPIQLDLNNTCVATARYGKLLSSDVRGQVVLCDSYGSVTPVGLKLQAPKEFAFIDEGTIVYYDEYQGAHVYDIEQMLDLGSCLTDMPFAKSLVAGNDAVIGLSDDAVYSQDVSSMKPKASIRETDSYSFNGIADSFDGSVVKDVEVLDEYYLELVLDIHGQECPVVIDGTGRSAAGSAQFDSGFLDHIESDYYMLPLSQITYKGRITFVALTRQTESGGDVISVGTSDGQYYELIIDLDGVISVSVTKELPNHAAIVSAMFADGVCHLLDANGLYWPTRIGMDMMARDEMYEQFAQKITQAFDASLLSTISNRTITRLDLQTRPGSDGRVWE